jgi:hypothetical protein
MSQWVRLWEDMPTDPKWRVIARKSGQSIGNVMAVFNFMLVCAANATERGELIGWNDESVAAGLDVDEENVAAIREAMQGRVLDGIRLMGWEKRQPLREDGAADRARMWRDRKTAEKAESERLRTQTNATEPPEEKRVEEKRVEPEKKEREIGLATLALVNGHAADVAILPNSEKIKVKRRTHDDEDLLQEMVSLWQDAANELGLPQISDISPSRQAALRARIKDFRSYEFLDANQGMQSLIAKIRGSPFLTGKTEAGFRATFDWILKPTNFHKIMDGNYETKPKTHSGNGFSKPNRNN